MLKENEPDFINDLDIKYWHNDLGTLFAIDKGFFSYICWDIEYPTGKQEVVLVDNATNKFLKKFNNQEECYLYLNSLSKNK